MAVTAKLNMTDGIRGGLEPAGSLLVAQLPQSDGGLDAIELTAGGSQANQMFMFRGAAPRKAWRASTAEPDASWTAPSRRRSRNSLRRPESARDGRQALASRPTRPVAATRSRRCPRPRRAAQSRPAGALAAAAQGSRWLPQALPAPRSARGKDVRRPRRPGNQRLPAPR